MGVRNTKFIMYGVETTYDEFLKIVRASGDEDEFYDNHELEYNDDLEIGWVSDGMGGEYAVFGLVLERFDEDDGDQMPSGVIDLSKVFKEYKLTSKRKAEIKFAAENTLGREVKLKKLFINHYS
jgi:hypothetical protein